MRRGGEEEQPSEEGSEQCHQQRQRGTSGGQETVFTRGLRRQPAPLSSERVQSEPLGGHEGNVRKL